MVGVFSVLGIMCAAGLITIVSAGIETKQRSLEELAVQERN
jgi:hypothetical protein